MSIAIQRKSLFPALVGAGISLLLLRTGLLAFFFLVPLGFIAYRLDYRSAWTACFFAVLGNFFFAISARASRGVSMTDTLWDIIYFGLMTLIFTGIVAPPPALSARYKGAVRFFCGSCLGALLLAYLFFQVSSSPGFSEYVNYLINAVFQANSSSGSDVVNNAILGNISAEAVLQMTQTIMLRGGSLVSCILLFAVCRQTSYFLARVVFRKRTGVPPKTSSLASFRVAPVLIWVFSASLLLVVLTGMTGLEFPGIILWNILVLCVILYFTQGLGILQFFLFRFLSSFSSRVFFLVAFFVVLFSPFLNALLLGGLFLLGVAENWVPLRAPQKNGPPSTPEAGGGGNEISGGD